MVVPVISDLPPAPTRSDGPADFTPKADAMIGALQPLVVQINIATQWMAGQLTAAQAQAAAAAVSAATAAESANLASQQVGLAAAQVGLANTARTGAEAARDDAQAAAIAAGAAAGLPPDRVPFSVLQINAAGAVSWGYGTPDASAAVVGQALILGPGKVPTWGYAGAQIGDILYTSRNPGAGYLPCNGGIYAQASYPVLFAQLGLIGGDRATSFVAKSATVPFEHIAFGDNGIVLAISNTAGSIGNVYRSTDYGATFALLVSALTTVTTNALIHLGGNKWLASINAGSNQILTSDDNGSTWSTFNANSGGNAFFSVVTDKSGVVLATTTTQFIFRSTDYGRTFVNTGISSARLLCYAGNGRWISSYEGQPALIRISDDAFATSQNRNLGTALSTTARSMDADPVSGTILISSDSGVTNNLATSYDHGETWNVRSTNASYAIQSLVYAGGDTWLIANRSSNTLQSVLRSTDGAKTFVAVANIPTSVSPLALTADQLKGYVIANAKAAGAAGYATSTPSFGYDTNTQFKLPTLLKQEGSSPYVRAL